MADARLLLVDDEPALAELLKKYLVRIGYEVDSCTTPEDALALFEADPERYALVLTDLTLPRMNGEEMIGVMRARNPRLLAVIASGYPYQPRYPRVAFLQKPFLPKMLADEIEKLLQGRKP
jgi:DNA-binding NtrC family response regulator